jgi:hypothetical protein
MTNFILVKDNILNKNECELIINYFKDKTESETINGINYAHFEKKDYNDLSFLKSKIKLIFDEYIKIFPQVKFTKEGFVLEEFRFKHFKPGNFFKSWHSEHSIENNKRILCLQLYLSEHNCGTEFYNGSTILSKEGRSVIFPAYFTHTHRGQVCPDNKDRYILGGYANFFK